MKFCNNCENLLIMRLNTEEVGVKQLIYHCNNCGFETEPDLSTDKCILQNNHNVQTIFIQEKNYKYICQDPTLPHLANIDCPNKACDSQKDDVQNDVVFIKINKIDMKYLYICCHCQTKWTNE